MQYPKEHLKTAAKRGWCRLLLKTAECEIWTALKASIQVLKYCYVAE